MQPHMEPTTALKKRTREAAGSSLTWLVYYVVHISNTMTCLGFISDSQVWENLGKTSEARIQIVAAHHERRQGDCLCPTSNRIAGGRCCNFAPMGTTYPQRGTSNYAGVMQVHEGPQLSARSHSWDKLGGFVCTENTHRGDAGHEGLILVK